MSNSRFRHPYTNPDIILTVKIRPAYLLRPNCKIGEMYLIASAGHSSCDRCVLNSSEKYDFKIHDGRDIYAPSCCMACKVARCGGWPVHLQQDRDRA